MTFLHFIQQLPLPIDFVSGGLPYDKPPVFVIMHICYQHIINPLIYQVFSDTSEVFSDTSEVSSGQSPCS